MENKHYDLIVIGAGPAGYTAAAHAARMGKSVAVAEYAEAGGTCLNRGCIPTKTLLHSSELYRQMRESEKFGVKADNIRYDFGIMKSRKEEVVARLRSGVEGLLKTSGVTVLNGRAVVEESRRVRVGDTAYTSDHILVATGSKPSLIPVPGAELPFVVTSDGFLSMEREYSRLTIIGGGVIGAEFASIYADLGLEVTVIEAADRILPIMDRDISQNLSVILKRRGVKIYTSAMLERIEQTPNGLNCVFAIGGKTENAQSDGVLMAVGRAANTEGLFSENLAAELAMERGRIPVSNIATGNMETRVKGIYAAGDVVLGGFQLAHAAAAQGVNAVCSMFGEAPPYLTSVIPSCVYTNPEIACVGMTADEAKAAGINYKTGKAMTHANGRSVIEAADRGFAKLVFNASTDVLIGAQLMCSRATDIIAELTLAITNKLSVHELVAAIRSHPAFCEIITEAAESIS